MDIQDRKYTHTRPSPRPIVKAKHDVSTNVDNLPPRIIQYLDDTNQNRHSVDRIIKKYKDERLKNTRYENSNQVLNINTSEHTVLTRQELTDPVPNFCSYVEPQYLRKSRNKDKHVTITNTNNNSKPLNENNEPQVIFIEQNKANSKNTEFCVQSGLTSREKLYADKTTYCRPVVNLYNEEFIHRTMERNSKLKRLLKKLAIARQREKETVSWNNYINELKNKHGPNCMDSRWTHAPQLGNEEHNTTDIIDDCYNTRFSWQQSRPCSNLLQDLYEGYYDPLQLKCIDRRSRGNEQSHSSGCSLSYYNDSYCYPTSSQGRLIALDRERRKYEHLNQWYNHLKYKNFQYVNNPENKKKPNLNLTEQQNLRNLNSYKTNNCINTANNLLESGFKQANHQAMNKLIQTFESDKILKNINQYTENNMTTISLVNIENKLETLTNCVNSIINEIELNKKSKQETKAACVTCELNNNMNQNINTSKSDTVDKFNKIKIDNVVFGGIFNNSSESTMTLANVHPRTVKHQSEIDDMLKEIDKFCSTDTKDMKDKKHPCSVNITFEVPTRDRSTEVTKSLSKQNVGNKTEIIEEISTETTPLQQMTIAVNTDPFTFLSLIRISTEALMRLLSLVPNINYQSYLAYLPFPHANTTRKVDSHYICNICGAAFTKPSALSDHIQNHNLGRTRDCCVCRHVLDTCRRHRDLFKCQFCGQRFTRAYCCELHQQSCAPRFGQVHDVSSSLVLLR